MLSANRENIVIYGDCIPEQGDSIPELRVYLSQKTLETELAIIDLTPHRQAIQDQVPGIPPPKGFYPAVIALQERFYEPLKGSFTGKHVFASHRVPFPCIIAMHLAAASADVPIRIVTDTQKTSPDLSNLPGEPHAEAVLQTIQDSQVQEALTEAFSNAIKILSPNP